MIFDFQISYHKVLHARSHGIRGSESLGFYGQVTYDHEHVR
jgi:hypothetical protein